MTKQLVYMRTVEKKPLHRALTKPLPVTLFDGSLSAVPVGFVSDGSSSGIFAPIFPKHQHPVAYFRHDYRCQELVINAEQRKWADREFRADVAVTSWWITAQLGYAGVRIGALFGIGKGYPKDPILGPETEN